MNNTTTWIVVIVIILLAGGGFWWWSDYQAGQNATTTPQNGTSTTTPNGNGTSTAAVAASRAYVMQQYGVDAGSIVLIDVKAREWPNSCFGVTIPGQVCAQVITPGYEITLNVQGTLRVYRTNVSGTSIVLAG